VSLYTVMSVPVFSVQTTDQNFEISDFAGDGSISLVITRPNLMPGRYSAHVAAGDATHPLRHDHIQDAAEMEIYPADVYGTGRLSAAEWTTVFLDCRWRLHTPVTALCIR
jgi:hypothetical protein